MRVVFEDDAARDVRDAQHDARQDGVVVPKARREIGTGFQFCHGLLLGEIDGDLRLMVERIVDAERQRADADGEQHKKNHGVDRRDLRGNARVAQHVPKGGRGGFLSF